MAINQSESRLTPQRVGGAFVATFSHDLHSDGAETITAKLVLPAMPQATVAEVEKAVIQRAIEQLQRLIR